MAKRLGIRALYQLSVKHCQDHPKYTVKQKSIRKLASAKASLSAYHKDSETIKEIHGLVHPPCVTHALRVGVVDRQKANRNQVTLFLAGYFKTIERGLLETIELLTHHALEKLAHISNSSPPDIMLSTRTAVKTVFNSGKYGHNCDFARKLGFDCNPSCELYAEYKKIEYGKKTILLPGTCEDTTKLKEFDTPEELREDLVKTIDNYVRELRKKNRKRRIKPLLIKAPAGAGKTITTFDWVSRSGLRCLWVGSQLILYDNIPPEHRANWRKIRGRQGDSIKDGTLTPGNCSQAESAGFLRDKNLNVHKHLCEMCDEYNHCDYYRQFEDLDHHWFVQQPMFLFKVKKYIKEFDVVIFDEDIMAQFKQEFKIRIKDFREIRLWVDEYYAESVILEAPVRAIKPVFFLRLLVDTFILLLQDREMGYPLSGSTLRAHLQLKYDLLKRDMRYAEEFYRFLLPDDIRDVLSGIDSARKDFLNNTFIDLKAPRHPVPLNFTKVLIQILEPELARTNNTSHLSRFALEKNGKELQITLNFKHPAPPKSKPTIILDATAKSIIYENLFGIPVIEYAPHLKFENEVWQIYSSAGGITSLRSNPLHRKRMLEVLNKLVKHEPDSLIICKQSMQQHVLDLGLVSQNRVTHFYGNRGSNEYEKAKQVIVFGAPGFPENLIYKYAAAFFHTENLVTTTDMQIKRYHGTDKGIKVVSYEDPRLQAILEISREDEIYQSLNRIRPLLDRSKRIVILSNIVIPELPVSRLLSINDIVGSRFTKTESVVMQNLRSRVKILLTEKQYFIPARDIHPYFPGNHRTTLDRNMKILADELDLKKCRYRDKTKSNQPWIIIYSVPWINMAEIMIE